MLKGVVKNVAVEKKPITVYKATRLPGSYMSPDDFITPTYRHRNDVAQKVLTVLANESPISETLLTRRVVQSYSIARAGSRIQSFMSDIYKSMNLNYTTQTIRNQVLLQGTLDSGFCFMINCSGTCRLQAPSL